MSAACFVPLLSLSHIVVPLSGLQTKLGKATKQILRKIRIKENHKLSHMESCQRNQAPCQPFGTNPAC